MFALLTAWFDAARVFESMCLLTILLSIAMEVHMDFFHQPTPERRMVEIFALVAGMTLTGEKYTSTKPINSMKRF